MSSQNRQFLTPSPTVCSNGFYADISNQHQVQQLFEFKMKARTKWPTSNFLIRDDGSRKRGVAQVSPDWERSVYPTLTEGRADHATQITTCPLPPPPSPILKPTTSP